MSKAGAPLYPSDSKPVLRHSRKMKDAKLIGLIAESVEASIVSPPAKGFLQRGFLGLSPAVQVISFSFEMGEPSPRGDLDGAGVGEEVQVGVLGYLEVGQDAKACYHTMGISFKGDGYFFGFIDFD
jgi:hypothetical protein